MKTPTSAASFQPATASPPARRRLFRRSAQKRDLGPRFDALFAVLALWLMAGLFLDGWAHYHTPKLETFFTPWHAVFYSGFLATAGCLIARQAQVGGRPLGYDLSLIGIAIFFVGGIGDGIWHTIFGFEQKVDSLFSPTHLLIATGGVLLLTGPLRASWSRPGGQGGDQIPWPALLSLLYTFNTVLLFVEYSHPFYSPALFAGPEPMSGDLALQSEMHAVLGVLVHAALMSGLVLFALVRWRLRPGSLLLLLVGSAALIGVFHDQLGLLPLVIVAALVAEALYWVLQPTPLRPIRLRLFAFALPFAYYCIYLSALQLQYGIWWSVHMATGAVVLAGVVGLLLSLLMLPPTAPAPQVNPPS